MNIVSNKDEDTGELNFEVNLKSSNVHENFTKLANDSIKAWEDYIEKEITSKPKKQIEVECPKCKHKFEIDYDFIITKCPKCGLDKIIVKS